MKPFQFIVNIIIAVDKIAGNETVTPEPVKGVAMPEEARPLLLIMSHSNNNKKTSAFGGKLKL